MTTVSQPAPPVAAAPPARRATTVSWRFSPPPSGCWRSGRFAEISVDDLAKGAGISRPTFYFYFPSKDAVLLTLFERVMAEADATFDGAWTTTPSIPPRHGATAINAFFEPLRTAPRRCSRRCGGHRDQRRDPRALVEVHAEVDRRTAAVITAERARGAAPDTMPAPIWPPR